MNFLPANIGGLWQMDGRGPDLRRAHDRRAPLEFAIRPEDLRPADSGLTATVRVVEPLGAHLLVTCDVDGASSAPCSTAT